MEINTLAPGKGSVKRSKRVGRGPGSGHGKTSCKGHKGQKARSGGGVKPGFEGGQMPLQRRLPKRGFKNALFTRKYAIVNLKDLTKLEDLSEITPELLIKRGVIKKLESGVKILSKGELKKAVTIKANRFSKNAEEKIVAAGGKAEVIN